MEKYFSTKNSNIYYPKTLEFSKQEVFDNKITIDTNKQSYLIDRSLNLLKAINPNYTTKASNSKLKSKLKYNCGESDLLKKLYSSAKNTINTAHSESFSREKKTDKIKIPKIKHKSNKHDCISNINKITPDSVCFLNKNLQNCVFFSNKNKSGSSSIGRSPRNRNVNLHQKISEKDTNSKTETTIIDKKENYNTNVKGIDDNSILKDPEIYEKEKYLEKQDDKQINQDKNNNLVDEISTEEKDKLICKLNLKILDLENKIKNMQGINKKKENNLKTIDNSISNNITNANTKQTDNSRFNVLAELKAKAESNLPIFNYSTLSSHVNPHNTDVKINKNPSDRKILSVSNLRKNKSGQGQIKDSVKVKFNEKYSINNSANNYKTLITSSVSNKINLDLFKPMCQTKNTIIGVYNSKVYKNNTSNNNNNKSSVKTSFESKSKIKDSDSAVYKSSNVTPRQTYTRKDFLLNEMKMKNFNSSIEFPDDDVLIIKGDTSLTEKMNKIKEKTSLLLSRFTNTSFTLVEKLKQKLH